MRLGVLGPLEVRGDDLVSVPVAGAKERLLLALLASACPGVVPVDRLPDLLWDGDPPPTARKTLQSHVVRLRSALEPGRPRGSPGRYVVRRGAGYALALGRDSVDALAFADGVTRGRALLAAHDPAGAVHEIASALALWRGDPYADWPDAPFAEAERRRLGELRASGVSARFEAELALGRHADVVPDLERLVTDEPLHEQWWALLVPALYRCGRQADALAAVRRARVALAEELGVDPGPHLRRLEQAVLTQDPSLDVPRPREASSGRLADAGFGVSGADPLGVGTCPYKGLAAYGREDAALFHGRAGLVSALVRRLVDSPVLVLSGPSGAGKSSVLRAGLVPALARAQVPGSSTWRPRVVVVGPHAVDALADLSGEEPPADPVVLVCDQLEQLWAPGVDPAERGAFLDTVLGLLDDGRVVRCVMAVRGDYTGRLAEHAELAGRVAGSVLLVPPLTDVEMREVVTEPARAAGLRVEPALVDTVVADVAGQVAPLPLLSTALVETWQRRRDDLLTLAGYLESGGVAGALARSAEAAYTTLDAPGRALARHMLVRLAETDGHGRFVRRAVAVDELGVDPATDSPRRRVLEGFVSRRLLTVDEGEVQVAHETLLAAWPRFARWLEDDATARAVRRHLTPAALEWDAQGRPDDDLLRGARLTASLDWAGAPDADLTDVERDYLDASRHAAEAELRRVRERAAREAATGRRTRRLASGLAVVLVVALVAAVMAAVYQRRASERADVAAAASTVADANRLAALSTSVGSLDLRLLLAAEAVRLADTPETRDGLLAALVEHRRAIRVVHVRGHVFDAALADEGRTLLARSTADVQAWDVGSPAARSVVPQPDELAASPSEGLGAGLCRLCSGPQVYVFPTDATREEDAQGIPRADLGGDPLDLAFDRRGRLLVLLDRRGGTGGGGFAVRAVDASARAVGSDLRTFPSSFGGQPVTGTFSDDGTALVLATPPPDVRATRVDLDSGTRTPLRTPARPVTSVEFLPLATGTAQMWSDGSVTLYDRGGRVRQLLDVHEATVRDLVLAPDGTWGVTAGDGGAVVLWDVDPRTGRWWHRETLTGHSGDVVGADLGPGARLLFTTSIDATVIVRDMTADGSFGRAVPGLTDRWIANRPQVVEPGGLMVAPTRPVSHQTTDFMGLAPDTLEVAATFLDARTGRVVDEVVVGDTAPGVVFGSSVAVSPGGRMVAVTSGFATTVLDTRTREVLGRVVLPVPREGGSLPGEEFPAELVWGAGWSPDGSRLVLAAEGRLVDDRDGDLVLVDTETWEPDDRRVDVGGAAQALETSPDGRLLAVAREDASELRVLDADTYERRATLPLPAGDLAFDLSFSPDGRYLAAGGDAGVLHVFDTATWERVHAPTQVHHDLLLQVEWMPHGDTVVSSGADGTVSLYDAERGLVRATPLPASGEIEEGFTHLVPPTSREIIALSGERPGRRYPMALSRWLAEACAVAGRDLTRAEWSRYAPGRPFRQTCGDLR